MKILVVLILVVFIGCQTSIVHADESKTQLEEMTESVLDYAAHATRIIHNIVWTIQTSELGRRAETRFVEVADAVSQYAVMLKRQMPSVGKDLWKIISDHAEILFTHLDNAKEHYAEYLLTQLRPKMEELAVAIAPYAESLRPYAEKIRHAVDQHVKDLLQKFKDLQA